MQLAAAVLVLSLAWPYYGIRGEPLPWPATAGVIGGVALLLATLAGHRWWWRVIHLCFTPLAWGVLQLAIAPGWFLLSFVLLALVYRGAASGQVPLYPSSRATVAAISGITAELPRMHLLDLGAGIGSVVVALARRRPDCHTTGIENAPASWLLGKLRARRLPNCDFFWGDLWHAELARFDVVYAYLSPAPMAVLWTKIRGEMRAGGLFISNSFPVPDVEPSFVVEVNDPRDTRLYCYRIAPDPCSVSRPARPDAGRQTAEPAGNEKLC
ncbi:trans-aconitate 2-methyltransferase [Accumulibacter sp.]|uniref:class I SAM-dependent methyltransferase n=1 Tax=Accumulibacter sp. TaxID=2053492 RepID=UPI0025F413EB|nr:class I SAM-dependent methyltransferase [Accumulibacter sp.]MCM8596381.1 class I SAM-dependent methyltransferase [Accumulibacter sp.]MCM8624830.1 class I SAM-dependent methyltransferase [Accumulibacter sp.]MDS4050530.1 class I SAM-dependent methyltransferase [Accumulibacter sp.]